MFELILLDRKLFLLIRNRFFKTYILIFYNNKNNEKNNIYNKHKH